MSDFLNHIEEMMRTIEEMVLALNERIEQLEAENKELIAKLNDGWRDRVTYENIVDQIASNEDPAQRDIARKTFEPLLKREKVMQLRRDIKRKLRELYAETVGGNTFNNYGTYNEVQPGGINVNQ